MARLFFKIVQASWAVFILFCVGTRRESTETWDDLGVNMDEHGEKVNMATMWKMNENDDKLINYQNLGYPIRSIRHCPSFVHCFLAPGHCPRL